MLRHIARASAQYSRAFASTRIVCQTLRVPVTRSVRLTPLCSRQIHSSFIQHKEPTSYTITQLDTDRYHRLSDQILEHIVNKLEEIGDETDMPGFDIEYSQGVMTISLGEHGTYVVNKQPPNHQIWLSSPISGPQRYDFDEKHHKWFYHRDNHTLDQVLNTELSNAFGHPIDLLEGYEPIQA